MFISSSGQHYSQPFFHSEKKSVAFGAKKTAIYKATEAENPELAIDKVIQKSKLSPDKLRRKINQRVCIRYNGVNRQTEQPLHRLLRNPRVTKRSVALLLNKGAELSPDLTVRNWYALSGYPYTTFLETVSQTPAVQQLKILFERGGKRSQLIEQSNQAVREAGVNTILGQHSAETSFPRTITSADMEATRDALDKVEHMHRKRAVLNDLDLSIPVSKRNAYKTWQMMGSRPRVRISTDDSAKDPIPNRLKNPAVITTLYEFFPRHAGTQQAHKKEFRNFIQEIVAWDYIQGNKLRYRLASTNHGLNNWLTKWKRYEEGKLSENDRPNELFEDPSVEDRKETSRLLRSITDDIMDQLPKPGRLSNPRHKPFSVIV